jgi:predicted ArsR family transcriptional regulator
MPDVEPRPGSKKALLVALLQRAQGATLDEMVQATGWLPHTTRAALTRLRHEGLLLERIKTASGSCYKIRKDVQA